MMTLEISMEREVVCMLTCSDLLEAEVEVFWLRGKRLNKPGVTGKREFGLLEGQGLEEAVEPGVEELVGVAGACMAFWLRGWRGFGVLGCGQGQTGSSYLLGTDLAQWKPTDVAE